MRRLGLTVIAVLLVSAALSAVENSVTFMPLLNSAQFRDRVAFIIATQAPVIQIEATAYTQPGGDTHTSSIDCHKKRVDLAARVGGNPVGYQAIFGVHLVTNVNVTSAGALTGSGQTLDTPATDAALLAAVAAVWSTVAGCVTNP